MSDAAGTGVRERVWVEKFDHATDPPTLTETVELLNGRVVRVTVTPHGPARCTYCAAEIPPGGVETSWGLFCDELHVQQWLQAARGPRP